MIKKKVINNLLDSGLVQPYDVIEHSYTDNGKRDLEDLIVSQDGVFPCMTTRPDCLGAVELIGGIGEKKSNGGTQYYEQDRVYNGEQLATAIPAEKSFHPYYTNKENMKLTIRKLVPLETMKLMGFERKDEQAMREIGMTDSAIYHCAGDSIITTCLMALFGQMLPISEKDLQQKIEKYVETLKEN